MSERGWSAEDVANLLGVDKRTIYKWLSGEREITPQTAILIVLLGEQIITDEDLNLA